MRPILFEIPLGPLGSAPIYAYGFMILLGFLLGMKVAAARFRAKGMNPEWVYDIGLIAMLTGILGSRLFYVIQYSDQFDSFWSMFMIWRGGLVFYGGFILATIALIYYFRQKKLPGWQVCDALTPSVALGLAFARFGCFLNGCCFGGTCSRDFSLGVHYPANSLAGQNLQLHGINLDMLFQHIPGNFKSLALLQEYLPQQLYDYIFLPVYPAQLLASMGAFALFLLLAWFYRYRRHEGEVLLLFGVTYSVIRFLLEILRDDTAPVFGTGLTISQNISYVLFCLCGGIFIFLRIRHLLPNTPSRKA